MQGLLVDDFEPSSLTSSRFKTVGLGFSLVLFPSYKQLNIWLEYKSAVAGATHLTHVFEAVKTLQKLEKVQLKTEKVKKKESCRLELKQIRVMKAGEMLTDGEQNTKVG